MRPMPEDASSQPDGVKWARIFGAVVLLTMGVGIAIWTFLSVAGVLADAEIPPIVASLTPESWPEAAEKLAPDSWAKPTVRMAPGLLRAIGYAITLLFLAVTASIGLRLIKSAISLLQPDIEETLQKLIRGINQASKGLQQRIGDRTDGRRD